MRAKKITENSKNYLFILKLTRKKLSYFKYIFFLFQKCFNHLKIVTFKGKIHSFFLRNRSSLKRYVRSPFLRKCLEILVDNRNAN